MKAARSSSTARSSRSTSAGGRSASSTCRAASTSSRRRTRPTTRPPRSLRSTSLRDGPHDLRGMPLVARRAALERIFGDPGSPLLRICEQVAQRRPRALSRSDRRRLGRPDCQARGSPTLRQAHARLAQAEADPRAGVRRRRMDRAARHAQLFGALLLGVYERQEARLRRARRQRVRRAELSADGAAEAARDARVSVRRAAAGDQRDGRTG